MSADPGGLPAVIVTGLVTIIVALIGSDRLTSKKEPITREDRLKASTGDMAALVRELAKVAGQAANAEDEAKAARGEADAAHKEARAAHKEAADTRARYDRLAAWAHSIVTDWPTIRLRDTPPKLPE